MSSRILMATVAAIALAVPAAAQEQAKPLNTEQGASQQLERPPDTPQKPGGDAARTVAPPEQAGGPSGAGQPPAAAENQPPAAPADELAKGQKATPPAEMAFIEVQDEAQFLADKEVIGKDVVNVVDEKVGTIADLIMDREKKLVGVVLSVGGFLGIGEKRVGIPVDEIDFPSDGHPARLLVAVTEEQLKNAPDFMTREAVEAEEDAAQAQEQAMQQQPSSPATTQ